MILRCGLEAVGFDNPLRVLFGDAQATNEGIRLRQLRLAASMPRGPLLFSPDKGFSLRTVEDSAAPKPASVQKSSPSPKKPRFHQKMSATSPNKPLV